MNMHAASGLCTHGVSNVGGVTAGPAPHNSSNVGGLMGHNSSLYNTISYNTAAQTDYNDTTWSSWHANFGENNKVPVSHNFYFLLCTAVSKISSFSYKHFSRST